MLGIIPVPFSESSGHSVHPENGEFVHAAMAHAPQLCPGRLSMPRTTSCTVVLCAVDYPSVLMACLLIEGLEIYNKKHTSFRQPQRAKQNKLFHDELPL